MLKPAPPLTTGQRQAMFQARNPGYDRRRKARKRANHTWENHVAMHARLMAEIENATPTAAPSDVANAADAVAEANPQLLLFPDLRPAA